MTKPAFFSSNSREGFSLLEVSIALIICGIIGGLTLPLLTSQMKRSALLKTRTHQSYVLNSLAIYVDKNKRFPCPADPKERGDGFGKAQLDCSGMKGEGILPFKTLGISEAYAKDGFKRWMTYVVDPDLTSPSNENRLMAVAGGKIKIKNEKGHFVLGQENRKQGLTSPNFIAFVLISHGESGIGSYLGSGGLTRLEGDIPSPDKRENLDHNFVFIEGGQTDDILVWESRDQFLKHYVAK